MFFILLSIMITDWQFTDVTHESGVTWEHTYNASGDLNYIPAGVAAGDVNGDGWVDLYVTGGANESNALFINQGDGTFIEIGESAGVARGGSYDCGPAFADVDGDGDLDLFVGAINGKPGLFLNKGDGTFTEVSNAGGLGAHGHTFGAAFADTDRDGDLDVFLAHWQTTGATHYYLNNGDGTFIAANDSHGFANQFRPDLTFTPNFGDINGDHWPDLLVASDLGHSQVFINKGLGHFVEVTDESVITDENGMGASLADYDNDGDLDWFVTAISPSSSKRGTSGNRLYRNNGHGEFEDITDTAGVREGYWGWASSFADFDNDGHLDIFHTNGFTGAFGEAYEEDPSRFFRNKGDGTFEEISGSLGLNDTWQGRGLACFDFDRDGDLDIFLANNGQRGRLLRNDGGNASNFLNIELNGSGSNRQALGARVEVYANGISQTREVHHVNNFASQDPFNCHFGLGEASAATVTITWPDGLVEQFEAVPANQFISYSQPDVGSPACDDLPARWLPHITPQESGFDTQVILKNFGLQAARTDVVAYDTNGNVLMTAVFDLSAHEQIELGRDLLFGSNQVTHLALYAPETVRFSSGYQLREGMTGIAHFHEDRQTAQTFYVYPGNWDIVYDGMALLNLGEDNAVVEVELFDASGAVLDHKTLSSAVAPNGKLLTAFNTVLPSGGSLIKITTNQPATALFLRGTQAGIQPGLLYAVNPIPAAVIPVKTSP